MTTRLQHYKLNAAISARLAFIAIAFSPAIAAAQISFQDKSVEAGIIYSGESWGASWGDFDRDGRPDLFTNNHRVMPSVYKNMGDGTFVDIAALIDVNGTWTEEWNSDTHGATWADFDNDGDLDLMVSNGNSGRKTSGRGVGRGWRFFENDNGIALINRTAEHGFDEVDPGGGRFPGWYDVNNDGLLDVMVLATSTRDAELHVQNGVGSFDDTGNRLQQCHANHYLLITDLNVDGQMEMICASKSEFPDKAYDTTTYPNRFNDITDQVPFSSLTQDTVIADFDGDLRPDILHVRGGKRLSSAKQTNPNFFESQIIATSFGEKTIQFASTGILSVISDWEYFDNTDQIYVGALEANPANFDFTLDPDDPAIWGIGDYEGGQRRGIFYGFDPDSGIWQIVVSPGGRWNLASFQITSSTDISDLEVLGVLRRDGPQKPAYLLNKPGGFEKNLAAAGINEKMLCISVVAGDFDNDMDLDFYFVCREGAANIANRLYENLGDGSFAFVAGAGGAEGIIGAAVAEGAGTGESVVTADYDSDGFLDLLVTNGLNESKAKIGGPYQLFRNSTDNGNNWIEFDLIGTTSNRDGIGARVVVTANGISQLREQNGGYHRWSQNHSRIHFGLAAGDNINVTVNWPSGIEDNYTIDTVNAIYTITEGGDAEVVDLMPPEEPPVVTCGKPNFDKSADKVFLLWQNCTNNTWSAFLLAGGDKNSASGRVVSDLPLLSVVPVSVEVSDVFDTSNPEEIVYSLATWGTYRDGFNFEVATGSTVTFGIDAPPGASIQLGPDRVETPLPFTIITQ